jgi:peptide/nickel transport system permease protein
MFSYAVRRIISTIPVMAVVALFLFGLLNLAPGDPAELIAGDNASPEHIGALRKRLGLDQPFFYRFFTWAGSVVQGDLGNSVFSDLPVSTLIMQRLEPTLSIMALTIVIALVVAIPAGVTAAGRSGSWVDRLVTTGSVMGFSIPVFVTAYVLAYIFAIKLSWLPLQGYSYLRQGFWPWLSHLIVPSLALASVYMALIARITRTSMLEVLHQDYIRTARAKGSGYLSILFVHGLKNAAPAILTIVGVGFASLIGGAVVTESIFTIPGIGRLTVDAIMQRDYPVIQGVVLFFSFVYVLINLLVDLAYRLFDPRIKF